MQSGLGCCIHYGDAWRRLPVRIATGGGGVRHDRRRRIRVTAPTGANPSVLARGPDDRLGGNGHRDRFGAGGAPDPGNPPGPTQIRLLSLDE